MNKYILIGILLTAFISEIMAQNADSTLYKRKSIGIAAGYYRAGLLDKTMSPLLYIGNGTNVSIAYNKQSKKSINQFELQFSYLPLYPEDNSIVKKFDAIQSNDTEIWKEYPLMSINAILSYDHLRNIKLQNSKIELFVGGTLYNYIQVMYPNSWILAYSIGPKGTLHYSINEKHKINTSLQFPLISIVERPPYATYNYDIMYGSIISRFYTGKLMWPNNFFYSKLLVEYQYTISEKISFSASYNNTYYKCKKNREYTSIVNALNFGVNYKF